MCVCVNHVANVRWWTAISTASSKIQSLRCVNNGSRDDKLKNQVHEKKMKLMIKGLQWQVDQQAYISMYCNSRESMIEELTLEKFTDFQYSW